MDLNHANMNGEDQGALVNFYLDLEERAESEGNTFELKCPIQENVIQKDEYIYVDGTEYGGIIDAVKVETKKKTISFKGRTWRGVLASKLIQPDEGSDYFVVSGEANAVLNDIIGRVDLTDMFSVNDESSGIEITSFKFRYIDAYQGIMKMLSKAGAKLKMKWNEGRIILSAVSIVDYSEEKEIPSEMFDFVIEETHHTTNHVVALGKGELSERQVVHKYLDEKGNITDSQVFFGKEEIMLKFDYPNCESIEELEEQAEEALMEKAINAKIKVTAYDLNADIGDKFSITDHSTGIKVTQYVVNKIISIKNGITKISYKVGDNL